MDSVVNESDLNVGQGCHVIKFWAAWCGPCKTFAPVVEKLDEEFDSVKFVSVDVDQVPDLAQKYKIRSLPTLLVINDGEEKKRILGSQLIKPLRVALREVVGADTKLEAFVEKTAAIV